MGRDDTFQWPTPTEWKHEVKAKLKERGRGAQAWLAREIGISTGHLSELLGPDGRRSEHVPKISKLVGVEWSPPLPSKDQPEIRHFMRRLSSKQQQALAQMAGEMTDEEFQTKIDAFIAISGVVQKKK